MSLPSWWTFFHENTLSGLCQNMKATSMSRVFPAGTICWFCCLGNYPTVRGYVTLSLRSHLFHHLGFGKSVTRSNLSKANETREVRIFQEFADRMVELARKKRDDIKDFLISNRVYAFDSSMISLCLFVYWWTKLHHGKGGVKLHELYDIKKDIPTFSVITDASLHNSQVMGLIPYEKDSCYIFDRAYIW